MTGGVYSEGSGSSGASEARRRLATSPACRPRRGSRRSCAGRTGGAGGRGARAGLTLRGAVQAYLRYVELDRKLRPSTVQDYRADAGHLLREFGAETPLEEITVPRIERWRAEAAAGGRLSPRTINKRLIQLGATFRYAQRFHGLRTNPATKLDREPERCSGDFVVLDPAEVELLAANAANEQDAVIFTVAAFSGLRLGEPLALRWSDIDWTLHLLHVRHNFTHGSEGPPKSGRVRSVPLVDQAAAALDRLRLEAKVQQLDRTGRPEDVAPTAPSFRQ